MINREFFADGIGNIYINGNTVRIDYVNQDPAAQAGQPMQYISGRVVMSLDGFMKSLAIQHDVVNKLVNAGIIKLPDQPEVPAKVQSEQE